MHDEQGMMNKDCTVYQDVMLRRYEPRTLENDTIAGQLNIYLVHAKLRLQRKLVNQHIILFIQTQSNIVFCCFNIISSYQRYCITGS